MNYTNFTIEKPVYICERSGDSELALKLRYIEMGISVLTPVMMFITLVVVNFYIRQKDKKEKKVRSDLEEANKEERSERERRDKEERSERERRDKEERSERERRDKEERLEKEERDKIADIIEKEYNKMEAKSDEKLRKLKEDFQAKIMFHGSGESKITGLDVLRFMLINFDNFRSYPLEKLQQDLNAVVTLFRSLRIKLPLKGDCPENIKEELAPLITGIGEIARSFVPAKDRYTITNVLRYFGSQEVMSVEVEDEKKEDDNHSTKMRRIFPCVDALRLGETKEDASLRLSRQPITQSYDDQDFRFDIHKVPLLHPVPNEGIIPDLESIERKLREHEITVEDQRSFVNKLAEIWRQSFRSQATDIPTPDWKKEDHVHANILHAVRVFMFKAAKGSNIIRDEGLKELVEEMKNKLKIKRDSKQEIYQAIEYIQKRIRGLNESQLKEVANNLNKVMIYISNSIHGKSDH